jgi:hypothetical protein
MRGGFVSAVDELLQARRFSFRLTNCPNFRHIDAFLGETFFHAILIEAVNG